MGSLLTNAVQLLGATLRTVGGEPVTYRRGNDTIDGLVVVPVRVHHSDLSLDPHVSITGREQDFIINSGDLAFALPQSRDEIIWNGRLYRVLARAGDRCYRFTDGTRQLLRVYTVEQQVSGE